MAHHDNTNPSKDEKPDPSWLADVEALSSEICAELREIVDMLTTYRQTIGNAARFIARTQTSMLIGDPETIELAGQLARMVRIEAEIAALLPPRPEPRLSPSSE